MIAEPRAGAAASASAPSPLRWLLPAGLLGAEYLTLSLLVDLPSAGSAMPLVAAIRVALPVVLGAAAAGWMVARSAGGPALAPWTLPPWRPLPALLFQPLAFAGTAALAMALLGDGAPPPDGRRLALVLGAAGVTALLAVGTAAPLPWLARELLRRWRGPLLALAAGVMAWRAAMAAEELWGSLSSLTLHAVAGVLRAVAGHATVDPRAALIGLDGFEVLVAPECSGADGLGLVITFQLLWIALARGRLRTARALSLVPLGGATALAANVLRISALVLLGAAGHEELAVGAFHSKAGWALFLAIAMAWVALAERLAWLREPAAPAPTRPGATGVPEEASLLPLLVTLAAALLTGMWAAGALDRAYAVRVTAGAAAVVLVRRALPALRPTRAILPAVVGVAVGVAWVALLRGDPGPLTEGLSRLSATERTAWVAVRVAGSVLVIPLVEELAFRGFLLGWLRPGGQGATGGGFPWAAVLVSSLAFGAMHASFALGAAAGVAFAVVRVRTGRIGDAVVAHAMANAVVAAAAVLLSRWDLWT